MIETHLEALVAQQAVFSDPQLTKNGMVEGQSFNMLARFVGAAAKELPDLLPPFNEAEFFSHQNTEIRRRYYYVLAIRSYLATAIARLRVALAEEGITTPAAINITREGVFFAGQYFDALQKLKDILAGAKSSIEIIDGYIDGKLLAILTVKTPGTEVRILTRTVDAATKIAAQAFTAQYGDVSIRTTDAFMIASSSSMAPTSIISVHR